MGYSISWMAYRGMSSDEMFAELNLAPTGERRDIPEILSHVELPSGWSLLYEDEIDLPVSDERIAELSHRAEILTCHVEEHAMVSSAARWSDGALQWRVVHDANEGLDHLHSEGRLPPEFARIRERLSCEQENARARNEGADYIFDVPIDLAGALTGFRHDEDIKGVHDPEPFVVLASIAAPPKHRAQGKNASPQSALSKPWYRRWLGI